MIVPTEGVREQYMEHSEIAAAFGEAGAAEDWAPGTVAEPLTPACAELSADSSTDRAGFTGDRTDPGMRAWRGFLQAHAMLLRRLEAELSAGTGMSLAHYDVLVQLSFAEGRRLRMHELANRVLLSRSGITRVVDRLEEDGLVARMACPSDARGAFAVLTDAGLDRLREATPVHLDGVRRRFVEPFAEEELAELSVLLERLAAAQVPASAAGPRRTVASLAAPVAAG
jgi:DNA-binding MarR family transcriptional regulator